MQIRTNFFWAAHSGNTQPPTPSPRVQGLPYLSRQHRPKLRPKIAPHLHRRSATAELDKVPTGPRLDPHPPFYKLAASDTARNLKLHHQAAAQQAHTLAVGRMSCIHHKSSGEGHQLQHRERQHEHSPLEPEKDRHRQGQATQGNKRRSQLRGRHRAIAPQGPLPPVGGHRRQSKSVAGLAHHPPPVVAGTRREIGPDAQGKYPEGLDLCQL